MKGPIHPTPYPSLGELFRAFALAVDSKQSNREVDRLVREGEVDWSALHHLREELVATPLTRYADAAFATLLTKFVNMLQDDYVNLVGSVSLATLSREVTLPLLIEHFFVPHIAGLMLALEKESPGPNLAFLLEKDNHPFEAVCDWIESASGAPLGSTIYPTSTDSDKGNRDQLLRWRSGQQLPDLPSISRLAKDLSQRGTPAQRAFGRRICRWLIVARALAWGDKQSDGHLRRLLSDFLSRGAAPSDLIPIFERAALQTGVLTEPFDDMANRLTDQLEPGRPKTLGEMTETKIGLEKLNILMQLHDPKSFTRFFYHWLKARWLVLSGNAEDSIEHFKSALELALYRAGTLQQQIMVEAMAVAARLERRPFLKQMKHRSIVHCLLPSPDSENFVEKWEVEQLERLFFQLFPARGYFPECESIPESPPILPFLVFTEEEDRRITLDLAHPNRMRTLRTTDNQLRRKPQLNHFVFKGDIASIQALLEHKADVNLLDDRGGSALLIAIQRALNRGDARPLNLLLTQTHTPVTLDSRTMQKRLTPLLCAIEYGDPEIVKRIIQMGANPNQKGMPENQSPLYYCLSILVTLQSPARTKSDYINRVKRRDDPAFQNILRRQGIPMEDAFGNQTTFGNLIDSQWLEGLFASALDGYIETLRERHPEPALRAIIEALLTAGANPNDPHAHPTQGRTPLMLAVECDCVWAFDLMMQHGGKVDVKDGGGFNSWRLAIGFGSSRIVDYLRRHQMH